MALPYIRKRAPFTPTDITGCQLWLDGNDPLGTGTQPTSGSTVATWADKSGNARNAPANTTGATFSSNKLGFTSGQYYVTPNFVASSTNTPSVFVVVQQTANTGGMNSEIIMATAGTPSYATLDIFGYQATKNATLNIYNNTSVNGSISISNPTILGVIGTGSPNYTAGFWGNGTLNVTVTGSATNPMSASSGYTIGANSGFVGNIYEIIFYSVIVTTAQQQQIEGYLAQKWNLKANLPQNHPGLKGIITPSLPVNLFIRYEYPTTFTPTQITGCALWLDAADASTVTGTTNVTAVRDKSPNNVNLSNATGYSYPNNSFNGTYPSFYCANGYSTSSSATLGYNAAFGLTMPFSMFFVGIQTNTGTYGDLCDAAPASAGANRIYTLTSGLAFQTRIGTGAGNVTQNNFIFNAAYTAGPAASVMWLNGVSYVTGTVAQFTCSGITVANRYTVNESFPGHICEVIAYNTGLTQAQREQVEGYLAWKWGLQANLGVSHPYKNASPSTTNALGVSRVATLPARSIAIYATARPPSLFGGSFQFTTTPSQYLSIPNSTGFTQNTAFTYELWYYPTSTNGGYLVAMLQHNWITLKWAAGGAGTIGLDMSYVGNAPGYTPQNRTYAINRWHHIALSWDGTNGALYMNGVSECVFTGAGGTVGDGNPLYIGQYQGQGQRTPLGYFTNIRFVKGVAVYTGAFTPPTAPLTATQSSGTNISAITAGQTQLLILATSSGTLLTDSSTNNFTITNNGSVAWTALTPFS